MFAVHTLGERHNARNQELIYNDSLLSQLSLVIIGHTFTLLEIPTGQAYINTIQNIKNRGNSSFHH